MTLYALTYDISSDLLRRAMLSWETPNRRCAERLRWSGLYGLGIVASIAVLIGLLQADILDYSALFGAQGGFFLAVAYCLVTYRRTAVKIFALSAGVTPDAFRAQLWQWIEAPT